MSKLGKTLIGLVIAAAAAPALAGAGNFTLVNSSGADIAALEIRRTGTTDWAPLPGAASNGASTAIIFSNPDCAFDVRARLKGDGTAVWSGLNLCEVSRVTLRRSAAGTTFADYE